MKKEFIINVVLLLGINLVIKVIYLFFIEVNVQNTIGPADYGLFLALFNLSYLFQFINDPGIHSFNVTHIAGSENTPPTELLTQNLPYILGAKICLGVIYLLVLFLVAHILDYESVIIPIILIIGLNHLLSSVFLYLRSNFSAIGLYKYESVLSALDKLLMILVIGGILISGKISLQSFVMGQTVSFFLASIIAVILLNKKVALPRLKFSLTYFKQLLKHSLPFALILLLMASYNRMDGVMLERLLPDGDYQAGIYAASFRFMEAGNMVVYLVAGLLLPMFATKKTYAELSELALLGIRAVSVIGTTIAVILILFRTDIMKIYSFSDPQYSQLVIYHMGGFCCIAVSYVYGTLITARARLKAFNWLLFGGALANFGLNMYLIPIGKAEGAALATFITQLLMVIGQIVIARKLYRIDFNYVLVLRVVFYILVFTIVVWAIREHLSIYWVIKVFLAALLSIIIAFLLGVLRKDMIFALIEIKKTKK